MTAAKRWRRDLEAWAIPEDLLNAAEESPYSWPVALWERRRAIARAEPEPFTADVVRSHLPERGHLVDVGAGTGRTSLDFARNGHHLTAVERDSGMASALREASAGLDVDVVEGSWPDAARSVGVADVVMSCHVVYDVQDIVPFLDAMAGHARGAVVLELSERHPWAELAPLYRALHDLDRPAGPTADDLMAVITETQGVEPQVTRWSRHSSMWYESWDELLEFMGRRLVLPRERRPELRELLEPETVVEDGRLTAPNVEHALVTMWWQP